MAWQRKRFNKGDKVKVVDFFGLSDQLAEWIKGKVGTIMANEGEGSRSYNVEFDEKGPGWNGEFNKKTYFLSRGRLELVKESSSEPKFPIGTWVTVNSPKDSKHDCDGEVIDAQKYSDSENRWHYRIKFDGCLVPKWFDRDEVMPLKERRVTDWKPYTFTPLPGEVVLGPSEPCLLKEVEIIDIAKDPSPLTCTLSPVPEEPPCYCSPSQLLMPEGHVKGCWHRNKYKRTQAAREAYEKVKNDSKESDYEGGHYGQF